MLMIYLAVQLRKNKCQQYLLTDHLRINYVLVLVFQILPSLSVQLLPSTEVYIH